MWYLAIVFCRSTTGGGRPVPKGIVTYYNFIVYQLLLLVGCEAGVENPSMLSALI